MSLFLLYYVVSLSVFCEHKFASHEPHAYLVSTVTSHVSCHITAQKYICGHKTDTIHAGNCGGVDGGNGGGTGGGRNGGGRGGEAGTGGGKGEWQ